MNPRVSAFERQMRASLLADAKAKRAEAARLEAAAKVLAPPRRGRPPKGKVGT